MTNSEAPFYIMVVIRVAEEWLTVSFIKAGFIKFRLACSFMFRLRLNLHVAAI